MPIIIKCKSCGFVLYNDNKLISIEMLLSIYGFRCPCCLSPLNPNPNREDIVIKLSGKSSSSRNNNGKRFTTVRDDIFQQLLKYIHVNTQTITYRCGKCGKDIKTGDYFVEHERYGKLCLECARFHYGDVIDTIVKLKFGLVISSSQTNT